MNSGYSSNNNKNENGDSQVKPHNVKKSPFIEKFSCKSKAGVALDGNFKTNQDSYLAKTKIFNLDNYSAFGVFDGHGMHGHFVSNMIKLFLADYYSKLDLFLSKERINTVNMTTTKRLTNINRNNLNTSAGLKEDQIYEKLKEKNCQIIKNSFYQAETTLSQSKYEVNFSGATCVIVLFVDDKIICANAGDSRAILVVGESTGDKIIPLSRDHKPEIKEESNRINKSGGRVERYTENGIKSGPFRVWLKNENFPGLAMSRSVGDFVAESVGVICEPGIYNYLLNRNI
jgi:serine/threonine protein phosphatase PrpC